VDGVGRAVKRIVQAIYGHENVATASDNDLDGIATIVLILDILGNVDSHPVSMWLVDFRRDIRDRRRSRSVSFPMAFRIWYWRSIAEPML
jgi:hypothetical protein